MIKPTIGRLVWYWPGGVQDTALCFEGNQPKAACFAEWMPYQKGQAAKTEALEAKIEKGE